jgi:hypothetical protein
MSRPRVSEPRIFGRPCRPEAIYTSAATAPATAHVWAGTAQNDAILIIAVSPLWANIRSSTRRTPRQRHQPGLSVACFGAHIFTSAPGDTTLPLSGHSQHREPGNPARSNIRKIVVKRYDEVS